MANGAILGQSTTTWTNNQILSSVSAALYSLGANATPDQVFAAIRPLITTAQNTANNAQSVANTAQQTANNASIAASTAQNTANNALSAANGKTTIVTGTYVGNADFGQATSNNQKITLGFQPKFVIVQAQATSDYQGIELNTMALPGYPIKYTDNYNNITVLEIDGTGFIVGYGTLKSGGIVYPITNRKNSIYLYIAGV